MAKLKKKIDYGRVSVMTVFKNQLNICYLGLENEHDLPLNNDLHFGFMEG